MAYSALQLTAGCQPETSIPAIPAGRQEFCWITSDMEPAGPTPVSAACGALVPVAPLLGVLAPDGEVDAAGPLPSTAFSTFSSSFSEAGDSLVVSSMVFIFWPMVAPGFLSPVFGGAAGSWGSCTTVSSSSVSTETTSPLSGLRFWCGSSAAEAGRKLVTISAAAVTAAGSTDVRGEVIGLALLHEGEPLGRGEGEQPGGTH